MNGAMRLLVDECVSPRVMETVNNILSHFNGQRAEFASLHDFVGRNGELYPVWIPKAQKAGYMVVSADQGKKKKGDKLPEICEKHGVKHILISTGLHKQGQLAITMAIFGLWRSIAMAWSEDEAFLRYLLRLTNVKATHEVGTDRPALMRIHRQERRRSS